MLYWELNSRPQCIFLLILQGKFLETIFYAQQLYFLTLCIIHLASTFILLCNGSYIGQQARWSWKHIFWAGNAEKNLRSFTFLREAWRLSEPETWYKITFCFTDKILAKSNSPIHVSFIYPVAIPYYLFFVFVHLATWLKTPFLYIISLKDRKRQS